ncbi:MAG: VOC family protein, partial [Phycisphaerales bacterium]|nr:VOC family protein [Phycisphaerales bacterium]
LCQHPGGTAMSDFNAEHNRIVWADIPVADLDRAVKFYGAVCGIGVHCEIHDEFSFAVLDHDQGNGACLVVDPDKISGEHGPLVYMNVEGRIHDAVSKVVPNGGTITQDTHSIGPWGFRALITDSEGNRLALHSQTDA